MPTKATHSGTCQCCGRFQKLPSKVLSKHGYTVNWGFFSGTCPGSGASPYELTCSDIKAVFIPRAQRQLDEALATIAALRTPTTSAVVTYRKYASDKYKSPYTEAKGTLVVEKHPEHDFNVVYVVEEDGTKLRADRNTGNAPYHVPYGSFNKTALEIINANRAAAADNIQRSTVSELRRYIEWQAGRVYNWKYAPLTETPDDYISPAQQAARTKRELATAKVNAKHTFSRLADRIEDKIGFRHTSSVNAGNILKYVSAARAQFAGQDDKIVHIYELENAFHTFKAAEKAQKDATIVAS